ALVVGGYNSSNTMHLVEILEDHFPTYHLRDAEEIASAAQIAHFNQWDKELKRSRDWLPDTPRPLDIAVTSGASCPDILVDEVVLKILSFFDDSRSVDEVLEPFMDKMKQTA